MNKDTFYIKSDVFEFMISKKECIGLKIVALELFDDSDGEEFIIHLENGKQIEICKLDSGKIHIQTD